MCLAHPGRPEQGSVGLGLDKRESGEVFDRAGVNSGWAEKS